MSNEKKLSYFIKVKQLIDPLLIRLEKLDSKISRDKMANPTYYRNEDLKRIFGLSNNTIIKYRQTGVLPFTKLGDIYFYDSNKIDKILHDNEIE
jgi:hypothetical protein